MKRFIPILIFAVATKSFALTAESACFVANEDDYLKIELQIANGDFTQSWSAYEDKKCTRSYLLIQRQYKILVQAGQNLDLTTVQVTYTAQSQETAAALSQAGYCNTTNWKINQPINVTGKDCDGYPQPKKEQMLFQILSVSESELKIGELTKENLGISQETRPDHFDPVAFLIK